MICNNCGCQVPDGIEICQNCGNNVSFQSGTQEVEYGQYQTVQNNMNYKNQPVRGQNNSMSSIQYMSNQGQVRELKDVEEILVDRNEKQIAVLGSNYVQNMMHGNGLKKGFGILTDKRYYFKGKCYSMRSGGYVKSNEEWCIDLKDITATGFNFVSSMFFAFLCIVSLIFLVIYFDSSELACCFGASAVIFFIVYILSKKGMYIVSFAGGSIALNIYEYGGLAPVKEFDKMLRRAKDATICNMNRS